jgi:hypothetical protein
MLRRATILISALALVVSAVGLARAATFNASHYTVTDLGGIDANWSGAVKLTFQGYSLTDSGLVTGYGFYGWRGSGGPPPIPVTYLGQWRSSTGFVPLYNTGDTGFMPYFPATGNDSGTVSYTNYNSPHGHLWTSGGGSTAPAALTSGAGLINSSGLVTGGDWFNGTTGVAYDSVALTSTTLPGVGMSINDNGQIGGSITWGTGFVWTKNANAYWGAAGTTTTLSGMGEVLSLSPDGRYAGGTDSTWTSARLYDASTHTYSTITTGEAYVIAGNGWIGGDTDGTGGFAGTGWLWDGTTLHNLNTELAIPGYTACAVMAINSSNQILVWGKRADYSIVSFLLGGMPGDANIDGKVDINDLSRVLTNYDQTGKTWADGDFDGNGTVDITDLSKVLTNYDKSLGASAIGSRAVPEPSTLLSAATGLVSLLAYTWRKRN